MDYLYFRCPWCESTYRFTAEDMRGACPSCGTPLDLADEPQGGYWVAEVHVEQAPSERPTVPGPVPLIYGCTGLVMPEVGEANALERVLSTGQPALVAPEGEDPRTDRAVLVHLTDLEALASLVDIRVVVTNLDDGAVHLTIPWLGAEATGVGMGDAVAQLAVGARRGSREALANPMAHSDLRRLALSIWALDCAGRLPEELRKRAERPPGSRL